MPYRTREDEDAVVLVPATLTADASVIWLHGLGADGHDFLPIVPDLRLPAALGVRFVFPHAPVRPVSLNQGLPMRARYDIQLLSIGAAEDAAGIVDSAARVRGYLQREYAQGIAPGRTVVAGFSQGGAIALHCGARTPEPLGGVLALSTYLPLRDRLAAEASAAGRATPILMCHGRNDPVVAIEHGELSRDALRQQGFAVQWFEYPMQHEVCAREIDDIAAWLQRALARP